MKVPIRHLVLDILKPHKPSIIEFVSEIAKMDGVDSAEMEVEEMDEKTESVKLIIEGKRLNFSKIEDALRDMGGSVHSIDKVFAGKPKRKRV